MPPRIAALIVAAGRGERLGGALPKQFLPLLGVPLLRRSAEAFAGRADITCIQVVIGEGQGGDAKVALRNLNCLDPILGGATRQESVRRGLEALSAQAPDFVLIHD